MEEWKQLLIEARDLGITVKEIEEFFNSMKDKKVAEYV
jgi:hypothetical protein